VYIYERSLVYISQISCAASRYTCIHRYLNLCVSHTFHVQPLYICVYTCIWICVFHTKSIYSPCICVYIWMFTYECSLVCITQISYTTSMYMCICINLCICAYIWISTCAYHTNFIYSLYIIRIYINYIYINFEYIYKFWSVCITQISCTAYIHMCRYMNFNFCVSHKFHIPPLYMCVLNWIFTCVYHTHFICSLCTYVYIYEFEFVCVTHISYTASLYMCTYIYIMLRIMLLSIQ